MANQDYLLGLRVRGHRLKAGTDDGSGTADFVRDVDDVVTEILSDWDLDEKSYTYLQDMKQNLDEYTNHLEFDAAHAVGYCVEILTGLLGMLFSGFKLMFENMRPSPRYNENAGSSWDYSYAGSGRYDEKQKGKKREKVKEIELGQRRERKKIKTPTDKGISNEKNNLVERQQEKLHRQALAHEINKNRTKIINYNEVTKHKAEISAEREALREKSLVNELAFSRF